MSLFLDRIFVEENIGRKYVEAAKVEFAKMYEDTSPSIPVFFILSPGVDPLNDVEKLGRVDTIFVPLFPPLRDSMCSTCLSFQV